MHLYPANVATELENQAPDQSDSVSPCAVVVAEKDLDGEKETEEYCKEDIAAQAWVVCELRLSYGAGFEGAEFRRY